MSNASNRTKRKIDAVDESAKVKDAGRKRKKTETGKTGKKNVPVQKKFGDKKFKKPNDAPQKPPDWAKFKKEKKLAREARRKAGIDADLLEIIDQAKITGEMLRRKKESPEERLNMTNKLHSMLKQKGYYKRLALAHDTSRIIQWMLKYGSPQVRQEASEALMDIIVEMLQSKYARNSVKRILKHGTPQIRDKVFKRLEGSVVKLASHSMSAAILDYAYTELANKKQKQHFQQEFYGDIYRSTKDDGVTKLSDTYKNSSDMKGAMLSATKANLLRVLNKNVHDCGLVHTVLYEYLQECNPSDRSEMITTLSPLVAPLSNSKPGVRAAIMCLWHGTNKDKKIVLKVLKEHATSLAIHEHGHLLILAALSAVDDTVLVSKTLLSTLLKDIKSLTAEEWGRKVILWLVAPRNKTYFHPSLLQWLDDGLNKGNAKKPADLKATELLKEATPYLSKSLQDDTEFWLSNGCICLTAVAILKAVTGEDLKRCLIALGRHICEPSWSVTEDDKEVKGIEHAGIHLSLKKLAQNDKVNAEKREFTFGQSICEVATSESVESWTETNRGCFLLITLFENNSSEVRDKLKQLLKASVKKLKKRTTPGAKILLEKINT